MSADRDPAELANQIQRITAAVRERVVAQETLPSRLVSALEHLDARGALTTADLAALADVKHQSMSATVLDLELKGFVDRRAHPTDVRKVLIELNADGRGALEQERSRRAAWIANAIRDRIKPQERQTLSEGVAVLSRLLG